MLNQKQNNQWAVNIMHINHQQMHIFNQRRRIRLFWAGELASCWAQLFPAERRWLSAAYIPDLSLETLPGIWSGSRTIVAYGRSNTSAVELVPGSAGDPKNCRHRMKAKSEKQTNKQKPGFLRIRVYFLTEEIRIELFPLSLFLS